MEGRYRSTLMGIGVSEKALECMEASLPGILVFNSTEKSQMFKIEAVLLITDTMAISF
jgi:hypothetical protein